MSAIRKSLRIEQGTSWAFSLGFIFEGESVDTSWAARGQIRSAVDSDVVLHEWSTGAGNASIALVDNAGSQIPAVTLTVDPSISAAWKWTQGVYDLNLVSPSGRVIRALEGSVIVLPQVTR